MNKGTYGYPLPPGAPLRIAPPEWRSYKLFLATTSTEVVPQNVFQMKFLVCGGGSNGVTSTSTGAGGGYAEIIVDVVPGQLLSTITVGGIAGTSSYGSLATATGASGVTPGTGSVSSTGIRPGSGFTASGGAGVAANTGGAASGSPYGVGGASPAGGSVGGAAWGGVVATSAIGATAISAGSAYADGILAIINRKAIPGTGGLTATTPVGIGCGSFSQADAATSPPAGIGGGGAYGATTGAKGGLGGGGGGSTTAAGNGGQGWVIAAWTEGY